MKKTKFIVKLQRPVCRTPIKPVQVHKPVIINARKEKHKSVLRDYLKESDKND